jgi:hypothetical protein
VKRPRDSDLDAMRRDYELVTQDAAARGPHPDEDVWLRLASGELSDDERARIVDHVVTCAECSAVYRAVAHVRHGASSFDPTAPRPAGVGPASMPARPYWLQALAASLTIVAAGLLAWNLALQRRTAELGTELERARRTPVASPAPRESAPPPAVQAHVNVPIVDLHPPSRVRGEGARRQVIGFDKNSTLVTLIVNTESPRTASSYTLELLDTQGSALWTGTRLAPLGDGTLSVALPTTLLRDGDHVFVLRQGDRTVHRYPVTFAPR